MRFEKYLENFSAGGERDLWIMLKWNNQALLVLHLQVWQTDKYYLIEKDPLPNLPQRGKELKIIIAPWGK